MTQKHSQVKTDGLGKRILTWGVQNLVHHEHCVLQLFSRLAPGVVSCKLPMSIPSVLFFFFSSYVEHTNSYLPVFTISIYITPAGGVKQNDDFCSSFSLPPDS